MSYYDFEHFWSPTELCQKQENIIAKDSLLELIFILFDQIYREYFPHKIIQSDENEQN